MIGSQQNDVWSRIFLKILSFSVILLSHSAVFAFDGSLEISVNQRFFFDERLGEANDFNKWRPEFEVRAGLVELPFRVEPQLGFSFIKNSARACAVLSDGLTCDPGAPPSNDRFKYEIYGIHSGLRWTAWDADLFPVIPFGSLGLVYRFARVRKVTAAVDQKTRISGSDLGAELGGGLLISFMQNRKRRSELESQWGMKDFGLQLHSRYIPAGWFKEGLGGVTGTGGWNFGVGLLFDW